MTMIWKETIVELQANVEYNHKMATAGNCVIVLNDGKATIRIGVTSGKYERSIKPGDRGFVIRPFPLDEVYLLATANTKINLIETKEEGKGIEQFGLQQFVPSDVNIVTTPDTAIDTNVISTPALKPGDINRDAARNVGVNVVTTPALKAGELNRDANNNVGVNIISTPALKAEELNRDTNNNIGVNVFSTPALKAEDINRDAVNNVGVNVISTPAVKPQDLNRDVNNNIGVNIKNIPQVEQRDVYEIVSVTQTSTAAALSVTLDTTALGRTIVNIFVDSSAAADFQVLVSNDNTNFRLRDTISLAAAGSKFYILSNNAYRFVRVETTAPNNNVIEITATR